MNQPHVVTVPFVPVGHRQVAAFRTPLPINSLVKLTEALTAAFGRDTFIGPTVEHGWTFVHTREGGRAEPGGGSVRGEAPEFFSPDPAPAPDGAETADPTGETAGKCPGPRLPLPLIAWDDMPGFPGDCHTAFWSWLPPAAKAMDGHPTKGATFDLIRDAFAAGWAGGVLVQPADSRAGWSYRDATRHRDAWAALDRMATPLHPSRLPTATADADARSMTTILDYVRRLEAALGIPAREEPDPQVVNSLGESVAFVTEEHGFPAPAGKPTFPCPRCGKPSEIFDHTGILCVDPCNISFDSELPEDERDALTSDDPAHQDWIARIRAAGWTPRHEETTQRDVAQAVPMDQAPADHPAHQPPEVVKRPRQLKRLGKDIDPPAAPSGDWEIPEPPHRRRKTE